VGRRAGLDRVVEEAQSEVSGLELQEREVREEEKRLEADEWERSKGVIARYISISGRPWRRARELRRAICELIEVGVDSGWDSGKKVLEWESRERREWKEERRLEGERVGAEGEERLQFSPSPSFLVSAEEE